MATDLTELASRARHDLRSPLTALKGFSSIILSQRNRLTPGQLQQFMEAICQAGDQIVRLVDAFEVLTRFADGERVVNCQPSAISTLIDDVLKGWSTQDTSRKFSASVPSDLPMVLCDPARTRLVIDTLIEQVIARAGPNVDVRVGVVPNGSTLHVLVATSDAASTTDGVSDLLSGRLPYKQGIAMLAAECIAEAQGGQLLTEEGMFALVLPVQ